MFQANAMLKHCKADDPNKPMLEEAAANLAAKFIDEHVSKQDGISQDVQMGLQEAFNVIADACQSATSLELEHHPNGIADDQIKTLLAMRKMALSIILEKLKS